MRTVSRTRLSRWAGVAFTIAGAMLTLQYSKASAVGDIDDGCLKCIEGADEQGTCVTGYHNTEAWHGNQGGIPHPGWPISSCSAGRCEDKHPVNSACKGEIENMALKVSIDSVVSTVIASTGPELLTNIRQLGTRVTYNPGRQSVQVTSCTGSVVANLPLTSDQIATLTDVASASQ